MDEEQELVRRLQQGEAAACEAVIKAHPGTPLEKRASTL